MTDNNFAINKDLPSFNSEEIKHMIPHRYPFLLVDRVVNVEVGERAVGIKNVTVNEPHFPGHFPEQAVMPGVLIIEAMAQTSAVFVVHTMGDEIAGKLVYFMSIDEAKFRKPVTPGDQVHIYVEVIKSRGMIWKFKGIAKVDGVKVAEAIYSAMVMDK